MAHVIEEPSEDVLRAAIAYPKPKATTCLHKFLELDEDSPEIKAVIALYPALSSDAAFGKALFVIARQLVSDLSKAGQLDEASTSKVLDSRNPLTTALETLSFRHAEALISAGVDVFTGVAAFSHNVTRASAYVPSQIALPGETRLETVCWPAWDPSAEMIAAAEDRVLAARNPRSALSSLALESRWDGLSDLDDSGFGVDEDEDDDEDVNMGDGNSGHENDCVADAGAQDSTGRGDKAASPEGETPVDGAGGVPASSAPSSAAELFDLDGDFTGYGYVARCHPDPTDVKDPHYVRHHDYWLGYVRGEEHHGGHRHAKPESDCVDFLYPAEARDYMDNLTGIRIHYRRAHYRYRRLAIYITARWLLPRLKSAAEAAMVAVTGAPAVSSTDEQCRSAAAARLSHALTVGDSYDVYDTLHVGSMIGHWPTHRIFVAYGARPSSQPASAASCLATALMAGSVPVALDVLRLILEAKAESDAAAAAIAGTSAAVTPAEQPGSFLYRFLRDMQGAPVLTFLLGCRTVRTSVRAALLGPLCDLAGARFAHSAQPGRYCYGGAPVDGQEIGDYGMRDIPPKTPLLALMLTMFDVMDLYAVATPCRVVNPELLRDVLTRARSQMAAPAPEEK